MASVDTIKRDIEQLYRTNPHIHINVSMKNPRVFLLDEPVTIIGVYAHIFLIEERTMGTPKTHTLQYADILTHQVEILELAEMSSASSITLR